MENSQLQSAKTQLAAVLGELKEKRANPFRGTALEALAEEIRTLRKTYRLSYREIAAKLTALKVDTERGASRRLLPVSFEVRGRSKRRAAPGAGPRRERSGASPHFGLFALAAGLAAIAFVFGERFIAGAALVMWPPGAFALVAPGPGPAGRQSMSSGSWGFPGPWRTF